MCRHRFRTLRRDDFRHAETRRSPRIARMNADQKMRMNARLFSYPRLSALSAVIPFWLTAMGRAGSSVSSVPSVAASLFAAKRTHKPTNELALASFPSPVTYASSFPRRAGDRSEESFPPPLSPSAFHLPPFSCIRLSMSKCGSSAAAGREPHRTAGLVWRRQLDKH